jgi:hypothetical protein
MDNPEKLATYSTQDENNQNKEHATICVGHHYVKLTSINNVNKT